MTDPVSVPQPIKTNKNILDLVIDSRDRDRALFPNSNQFTINFNNVPSGILRNVSEIEIIQAFFPSIATQVPYISLEIPHLNNQCFSGTNDNLARSTAIFSPQRPIGTDFIASKRYLGQSIKLNPVRASIDRLSFVFRQPDGDLFDFGTDTSHSSPPDPSVQVAIYLRITHL